MIQIRKSDQRGFADHGWLKARHSFSFADYFDPANMGFRVLRVINEDRVEAGQGFGTHPHRDMEIITYVIEGALEHKDSMGNGSIIRPGEVQYMSAGSGVTHSEFNPSKTEETHLLQIWLLTAEKKATPRYAQQKLPAPKPQELTLIASPNGENGSIAIRQNAKLFVAKLAPGESLTSRLDKTRYGWIQVVRGDVKVNAAAMAQGDGAALSEETELKWVAGPQGAECLFFDLP